MLGNALSDRILDFIEYLDGFTILDKDGYYLYVSKKWSEDMGYILPELMGKKAWDIFPETQSNITLATGKTIIGHPVKYGKKQQPGFTNYYPIFDADGSVMGCYCLVMITGIDNAIIVQNQITELYEKIKFYEKELLKKNGARYSLEQIWGTSEKISNLKNQIKKVSNSNSTVLIEGETGTGKELVAHAIHQLSTRNTQNFVRVNCAAIPPELMESEFFGYTKGSFTGASSSGKMGKFQFADKGSIFLDEINSLSLTIQPKFLRALQEREIEPIGSTASIPIDIRVIAASNTSLESQVVGGSFRRDLYYRLNVVRIIVPPLRERKEDIPQLVDGFIKQLNKNLGMYTQSVSSSAMRVLMQYDWPGNVRELQNALEAAMNVADSSVLRKEDFYNISNRIKTKEYRKLMQKNEYNLQTSKGEFERDLIIQVIKICEYNHSKAAEMMGISRTMLYKKLAQYQIDLSV